MFGVYQPPPPPPPRTKYEFILAIQYFRILDKKQIIDSYSFNSSTQPPHLWASNLLWAKFREVAVLIATAVKKSHCADEPGGESRRFLECNWTVLDDEEAAAY